MSETDRVCGVPSMSFARVLADRERNFDVIRLATKPPRHQEHVEIFSACLRALVAKLLN